MCLNTTYSGMLTNQTGSEIWAFKREGKQECVPTHMG